uniref:Uncharacterized protein n=1 Tax=Cacopsylla melanoneura TaxID=428564 RepID=A0A8D8RKC1_9HEMI
MNNMNMHKRTLIDNKKLSRGYQSVTVTVPMRWEDRLVKCMERTWRRQAQNRQLLWKSCDLYQWGLIQRCDLHQWRLINQGIKVIDRFKFQVVGCSKSLLVEITPKI